MIVSTTWSPQAYSLSPRSRLEGTHYTLRPPTLSFTMTNTISFSPLTWYSKNLKILKVPLKRAPTRIKQTMNCKFFLFKIIRSLERENGYFLKGFQAWNQILRPGCIYIVFFPLEFHWIWNFKSWSEEAEIQPKIFRKFTLQWVKLLLSLFLRWYP